MVSCCPHTTRRRDEMAVSDSFAKLKQQIEEAERAISAAASEDEAAVKAKLDEARKSADERAAELRAKSDDGGAQAASHWQEVRGDWVRHRARVRQRIESQKAAVDIAVAADDVESADADAMDAIDFAGSAIEEAKSAVLEAVLAGKKLDALAPAAK